MPVHLTAKDIFVCTVVLCFMLITPSTLESQPENSFPWLTGLPSAPENRCDDIPEVEWIKFRRCSLQSNEAAERRREELRRASEEAAAAELAAAWSFMLPAPIANCEGLPRPEYPKFSCVPPEEDTSAILAGELGVIMAARDALKTRYNVLLDRDARVSLREDELAGEELWGRLDQLKAVESALDSLSEKRILLDRFSSAGPSGREGQSLRFARVLSDVSVFASDGDARTLGRLPENTMVVAIETDNDTRFVHVYHQSTGYGFIRASDLSPPEF